MNKPELRKIYLRKRKDLTAEAYHQLNQRLCENFFAHVKLSDIRVLHTFIPIERNREVNTWLIIERLERDFPHVRVSIPKINNQTAGLDHYFFENRAQLKNNTFGIPEPVRGISTPVDDIDAVIVPLLAFDKRGHRLGYGGGFYDRFLSQCRHDCMKIGISYFDMEEDIEGIHEKDITLNIVITPTGGFVL